MFYKFQSGPNEGKSLELLAFNNPSKIKFLYGKLLKNASSNRRKNQYEIELENVVKLLDKTLCSEKICPICGKDTIKFLSIRFSSYQNTPSISPGYSCCENENCKEHLKYNGGRTEFYPLKLSYALKFQNKTDVKFFIDAIKFLLGIKRLDEGILKRVFYENA